MVFFPIKEANPKALHSGCNLRNAAFAGLVSLLDSSSPGPVHSNFFLPQGSLFYLGLCTSINSVHVGTRTKCLWGQGFSAFLSFSRRSILHDISSIDTVLRVILQLIPSRENLIALIRPLVNRNVLYMLSTPQRYT